MHLCLCSSSSSRSVRRWCRLCDARQDEPAPGEGTGQGQGQGEGGRPPDTQPGTNRFSVFAQPGRQLQPRYVTNKSHHIVCVCVNRHRVSFDFFLAKKKVPILLNIMEKKIRKTLFLSQWSNFQFTAAKIRKGSWVFGSFYFFLLCFFLCLSLEKISRHQVQKQTYINLFMSQYCFWGGKRSRFCTLCLIIVLERPLVDCSC